MKYGLPFSSPAIDFASPQTFSQRDSMDRDSNDVATRRGLSGPVLLACTALLLIHVALLAWLSVTDSPVPDEVKQIPAGLRNWHGEYALYRVTPPLVRYVANVPLLLSSEEIDWMDYPEQTYNRQETNIGRQFIEDNGLESFRWYKYGRWLCIPWSILGAAGAFHWSRRLYGDAAGLLTLVIWSFSPLMLAHGHYVTTDMAVTAVGLWACYIFWKWLASVDEIDAALAGLMLGIAILAKTTCIVLFVFWPLCLCIYWYRNQDEFVPPQILKRLAHLGLVFITALFVINAGYFFTGSFAQLGEYEFRSKALAGDEAASEGNDGGNRFRSSVLRAIPVPLPFDFVQGVDWQKADFERTSSSSYLLGENRSTGWWEYYLIGLAVKEPLGVWILALLAVFVRASGLSPSGGAATAEASCAEQSDSPGVAYSPDKGNAKWFGRDEWFLWVIALMMLALVSSQTGLSRHLRYVMPAIPYFYILAGSVAAWFTTGRRLLIATSSMAAAWLVVSSLMTYPYSIAYFNEVVGNPRNGNQYVTGSNIDWGQDIFRLRQWIAEHPEATPIYYRGNHTRFDLKLIGTAGEMVPKMTEMKPGITAEELLAAGPQPGWFAVSVNYLSPASSSYRYLDDVKAVAEIGLSTRIYHLTLEDANRLRRRFALPELSGDLQGGSSTAESPPIQPPPSEAH